MNKEELLKEIEHIANCELYDTIGVKYLKSNIEKLFEENKQLKLNHKQLSDISKIAISNSRLIQENKQLKEIINKTIELTQNLLKTEDRGYYQILFKEILKSLGNKNEDIK